MTDLVKRLRDNFDLTECEHGFRLDGGHTCPNEDCDRRDIRKAAAHIEALEAENERLTLRLAECAAAGSTMRQTISEFHAENERLREALQSVTPPAYFGESEQRKVWWAKARAALGEK